MPSYHAGVEDGLILARQIIDAHFANNVNDPAVSQIRGHIQQRIDATRQRRIHDLQAP